MVLGDVQLQGRTKDPLQEGVVKVLRYAGAFRQAVLKTTVHALTVTAASGCGRAKRPLSQEIRRITGGNTMFARMRGG